MKHRLLPLVIACCQVVVLSAQQILPTQGEATRAARNGHDIHHPRNDALRQQLMQEAVRDAVERVAGVQVSVITELGVQERRGTEETFFVEDLRTSTVQRVGIRWTRNAPFTFSPHPTLKQTWICRVSGTVQEVPLGPSGGGLHTLPYTEVGMVRRKHGAQVVLSPAPGDTLQVGDRIAVFGPQRSTRTGSPDQEMTRSTGSVLVTDVTDGLVSGTVLRGRWNVRPGQRIAHGDFPLLRGGVKLRFGVWAHPPQNMDELSTPLTSSVLSIGFFEHSLVQHWGVELGVEVTTTALSPTRTAVDLFPHVGVFRPFALVPEVLHLGPSLSGGMALLGGDQVDAVQVLPFFLDLGVELDLRLGAAEVSVGLRDRSVLGAPWMGGTGLFLGLQLDLYRLANDTEDRSSPGLGRGVQAVRSALGAMRNGAR